MDLTLSNLQPIKNVLTQLQKRKVEEIRKEKMSSGVTNATAVESLNVLRWRNVQDKIVEKKV